MRIHLGSGVGDEGESPLGDDLEAEVAAPFDPFVGLFGQHRADEADDRVAVEEDAHGVGAAANFTVEALVGVVGPDLLSEPVGEPGEREDVRSGTIEVRERVGELLFDVAQEPVELGVHAVGAGLSWMEWSMACTAGRPRALRADTHQVRGVVGSAALPDSSRRTAPPRLPEARMRVQLRRLRRDRFHEPGVRVAGDEADPAEAAGDEVGEEAVPRSSRLRRRDPQAQDFPVPVAVHASRDEDHGVDDPAALADFHGEGVGGDERERAGVVEGAVAELVDVLVEVCRHPGHLRFGQRVDSEGLDELVHPPGRDPGEVAVRDDGDQRGLRSFATLEQPFREVGALAQLRDLNVDRADTGIEVTVAVAVARCGQDRACPIPRRDALARAAKPSTAPRVGARPPSLSGLFTRDDRRVDAYARRQQGPRD